jgi:hypothetical protein
MADLPKLGFTEITGEARLVGEYLRFRGDVMAERASHQAAGNWRPVLLIPGFLASDATLYPLGARLRSLGHRVHYSGIWMNADCPAKTLDRLQKRVHSLHALTGRKLVLIGHSLGGVYARELARRDPGLVERAVLLGAPVKHVKDNATPYLRPFIAAMRFMHMRCMESIASPCPVCGLDIPETAPDVPETVIYTKSDGVVAWHSCIDEGPLVECIEVESSHCGIPLNLKTWEVIANRLSTASPHVRHQAKRVEAKQRHTRRTRPGYLRLIAGGSRHSA